MAILASLVCFTTAPVAFAPPPWADDDPRRAELAQRLDDHHLARRIERAVARLDLTPLWPSDAGVGSLPCRPDLLLRAVLYEGQRGQHRPAAWPRDAREAEPVRWLLRGVAPWRSCWYAFRDRLAPWLDEFNRQALSQAVEQGLTPATRGAADGTRVAANASRRRRVHAATLHPQAPELAAAVAADERGGTPPTAAAAETPVAGPAWMAKTPTGRRTQPQRMQRAQQRLAALPTRHRDQRASQRKAAEQVMVRVSDPEAVVGRDKEKVYRPLYNVHVLDDLDSPLLLADEVFAQPNDAGLLATMRTRSAEWVGHPPRTLLADTASAGGADLAAAAQAGVTRYAPWPTDGKKKEKQIPKSQFPWRGAEGTYACPQGRRLEYTGSSRQKRSGTETVVLDSDRCPPRHCRACPLRQACTPNPEAGRSISRGEHEEHIEALRTRMATAEAKERYRQRSQTVELVNADGKQHRKLRRFSGCGRARVRCQVGLVVLAHNLVTLLSEEKKAREKKEPAAGISPPEVVT